MDKRIRSPNYPAISLPEAINRVTALYRAIHTHAAPRDVVAKGMGYTSLNGASATSISALHKYGLLERLGDDVKVSERALSILHPHTPQEKADAIRAAAGEPALFSELAERFPGAMPNEELLRNYLVRKRFAPAAIGPVIAAYRDTSDMVASTSGAYDSPPTYSAPELPVISSQTPSAHHYVPKSLISQQDERQIGRYDFEGGGFVKIVASAELDTEDALDMVETIINLKRNELAFRKQRTGHSPDPSPGDDELTE